MTHLKSGLTLALMLLSCLSFAQLKQSLRGVVRDFDTRSPLIGATVAVKAADYQTGAITDINGNFIINDIPVGRIDISITYVGYEPKIINQIDLKSGKELVLEIDMIESVQRGEVVVITATKEKDKPLNEMATVSARSFSVEETKRYAAAAFDPARMAQNYAGVTSGGDDLFNEIVVRGNSPKGVLWRLEGIEIANPNHFSGGGGQGGAISMLSSSILTNSDFYTGAFPAEYGNALSGVFDLSLRKGNNKHRESSVMLGSLGLELSTEGPFSKKSKASYLVNYRYSTLGLLELVNLSPVGDFTPKYQDISFNVYMPTNKYGNFSLFGIGGYNDVTVLDDFDPKDTSIAAFDAFDGFSEKQWVGILGMKHVINIGTKSYLKTVVSGSYDRYRTFEEDLFLTNTNDVTKFEEFTVTNLSKNARISSMYNRKINNRHTVRSGVILSSIGYDFYSVSNDFETKKSDTLFNAKNSSFQSQVYAQWKYRITTDLTFNGGFHHTYLAATNAQSFEPRMALKYNLNKKSSVSFAFGKHSKAEHLALYLYENHTEGQSKNQPNKNLGLTKAWHYVVAFDHQFSKNLRLKTEVYYQSLFDVPVADEKNSTSSVLNASSFWDVIFDPYAGTDTFVNNGTGTNYGIDITLEKFFDNNYYYLLTGTLFDSRYTTNSDKKYNTRYNGKYQFNLLGGKEFKLKKKERTIGVNAKLNFYGGNRYTPINIDSSILMERTIRYRDQPFGAQVSDYFRFDCGISYKFNREKSTHTILLDIQNVTGRANPGGVYYDNQSGTIESWSLTGFFPFFNYRIEF